MQFAWIFILVVGAIILAFFVMMVQKHRTIAKEEQILEIRTRLGAILTNAKQSTGTLFRVTLPKEQMRLDCSGLAIGEKGALIEMREAFGPDLIKSSTGDTFLWVVDWSVPFKVDNMLLITTPNVRYAVAYTPGEVGGEDLLEALPDNLSVTPLDLTSTSLAEVVQGLSDQNHYKVRIVRIKEYNGGDPDTEIGTVSPPVQITKPKDKDVTLVAIDIVKQGIGDPLDGYGTVTFYTKQGSSFVKVGEAPYFGRALLYGAVFSDNFDTYNCTLKKAFGHLRQVATTLKIRSSELMNYSIQYSGWCGDPAQYDPSVNKLNDIIANAVPVGEKMNLLYAAGRQVVGANRALQLKSCPLIY
ncbi:MAG: hypothetical protein V1735_05070 [Nanoarchaeota archaeon]